MAASAAVQSPASWPATRQGRLGIRAPPEWMQPNSLSLDRSFRFSVGGGAAAGCRTCGAQPPWPSAVGSASGRTGECVPSIGASTFTLAAPGGADDSPANLHDRVYERYGPPTMRCGTTTGAADEDPPFRRAG